MVVVALAAILALVVWAATISKITALMALVALAEEGHQALLAGLIIPREPAEMVEALQFLARVQMALEAQEAALMLWMVALGHQTEVSAAEPRDMEVVRRQRQVRDTLTQTQAMLVQPAIMAQ
jgi:type IV secretory pathway TrbD component